jgi:hypothetical protein
MTYAYHIACASLPTALINERAIESVDMTPSLRYYGTAHLTRVLTAEEEEEFRLYRVTEDSLDNEAEAGALYRAEMGYMP